MDSSGALLTPQLSQIKHCAISQDLLPNVLALLALSCLPVITKGCSLSALLQWFPNEPPLVQEVIIRTCEPNLSS